MGRYHGFVIVYNDFERSNLITNKINNQSDFSEALSLSSWKKQEKEIFLVVVKGELKALCLAKKGKLVVTKKYHVLFSQFVKIEPYLTIKELAEGLDSKIDEYFTDTNQGNSSRLPEKMWSNLIDTIKELRPEIADKIDLLFNKRLQKKYSGPNVEIESYKRDAIIIALNFSGLDPKKADFNYATPNNQSLPPFLEGMDNITSLEKDQELLNSSDFLDDPDEKSDQELYEDQMLSHDAQNLPEATGLPSTPDITAKFSYNGKVLKIWNYNRHPIEQQLGVDLIYYHAHFDAYIMVQYKRLKDEYGNNVYRLNDKSYKKELKNMETLESLIHSKRIPSSEKNTDEVLDYRFHNGVCYFKLCDPKAFNYHDHEMIRGMYFSLDYWKELISNHRTDGVNGGKLVSYSNSERYFSNTQFTDLVKNGWIGSKKHQSKVIRGIINEILRGKRSVILANYENDDI